MVEENFELPSLQMFQNDYFIDFRHWILHHGWRKFEIPSLEMFQNDYFTDFWHLILHHGWRKFWNFISWNVPEWVFHWFLIFNSSKNSLDFSNFSSAIFIGITFTSLNLYFDNNLSRWGISSLQGAHQVAQKLIIVKFCLKLSKLTLFFFELKNSTF